MCPSRTATFWKISLVLLLIQVETLTAQQVELAWTEKLGDELWHLSQLVTKHSEIKTKYRYLNARVDKNDGRSLLDQIIVNIGKMIQKKVEAVKCIMTEAEKIAEGEEFYFEEDDMLEYYNMKYSYVEGTDSVPEIPYELENSTEYKNMTLMRDPNFYNIPVNTEHSAVHIPTNLYDRYPHVAAAISWSEGLNDIFYKNYHADPSLSWQYFGALSGMMRQFPAMQWKTEEDQADLYDCRTRPWFIEAATCTKDMIVLMDNSGSMTGMRNTIAKLVVNSILETFGNNDFINVLKFSWTAEPVLPCFDGTLAQATPENVKLFQDAVSLVSPEGNASIPNAFTAAFNLLEKYRESRGCDNLTECNQAIMLVTDGLPGNITEVFEKYNRGENGSVPVRVFTYLVGTEVRGVEEIQLMACQNRGYYVHIHNLDEVRDQVLKYIPVIARPLVLQKEEHPTIWTHAFADVSDPKVSGWLWKVMENDEQKKRLLQLQSIKPEYFSQRREDSKYVQLIKQVQGEEKEYFFQEYSMMTSVSMPAFDLREDNGTRKANLLGVAGTDVPISQLYTLTYPYKIGANGYAFIVTNNGYLLMHPDLRPVFEGIVKLNYNSVDLAEVEFTDDDNDGYQDINPQILRLREAMVNRSEDQILDVDIKFHYDDLKRVGTEKRDFYISPLPDTPYSIGLAIPSDYGDFQIAIGDEVQKSLNQGIPLERYFNDKPGKEDPKEREWSIHPDWIYCKYRFASHLKFDSREDELLHFLEKMFQVGWKWTHQYPDEMTSHENYFEDGCDPPPVDKDSYYCDKDLIQLLIFDAKVTEPFKNSKLSKNSFEEKKLKTYNTTLRFVSTQSGLTRWQLVPKPKPEDNITSDFGNMYPRAIDEPWYKAAVLQHQIDREAFVYSVPFDTEESEDVLITATHAIFPVDGGNKAPASVVGYKMTQKSFYDRFLEITSKTDEFSSSCLSDDRECYVLDHNGYIILSTNEFNETGKFFGEYEPSVMTELVDVGLFREIIIYDYQSLCIAEVNVTSDATSLLTPFVFVKNLVNFVFTDLLWSLFQSVMQQIYSVPGVWSVALDDSREFKDYDSGESLAEIIPIKKQDEDGVQNVTVTIERISWPCDQNTTLYLFQQTSFPKGYFPSLSGNDSRLHFAKRIPHSNMILIVLNTLYPISSEGYMTTEPQDIPLEVCHRSNLIDLPRQRSTECFTQHPLEMEIETCGRGNFIRLNIFVAVIMVVIFLINY